MRSVNGVKIKSTVATMGRSGSQHSPRTVGHGGLLWVEGGLPGARFYADQPMSLAQNSSS